MECCFVQMCTIIPKHTRCNNLRVVQAVVYTRNHVFTHTHTHTRPATASCLQLEGSIRARLRRPCPPAEPRRHGGHRAGSAPGHRGTARTDPPGSSAQGGGGGSAGEPGRRSRSSPLRRPLPARRCCIAGTARPSSSRGRLAAPATPRLVPFPARRGCPAARGKGGSERVPPRRGERDSGGGCREAAPAGGKALRFCWCLEAVLRGSG